MTCRKSLEAGRSGSSEALGAQLGETGKNSLIISLSSSPACIPLWNSLAPALCPVIVGNRVSHPLAIAGYDTLPPVGEFPIGRTIAGVI